MAFYRVRGGFTAHFNGSAYPAGATLKLTEAEILSLGHVIEPVPEPVPEKPKSKKEIKPNAGSESSTES